jgi:hypothetical protein
LRDSGEGFRRYPFLRSGELRAKRLDRAPEDRRQSFDDVAGRGAGGAWVERASRHGKNLPALLAGKAGGDQGA